MPSDPHPSTTPPTERSHVVVFFHAHPDDEALLTSGTMAKAAAAGHRVVLVVATDGALGLASSDYTDDGHLGERRWAELERSARVLGVARLEHLGYADSGMGPELYPDPPGRTRFCRAEVAEAAQRLATILDEEAADVLVSYDPNGGYGHRDHVRVHEVGTAAARLARTPRHLMATIPRDLIARTVELVAKVYRFPADFDPTSFRRSYAPRADITHRVDVRRFTGAKRAAMAAHASQATADEGDRTLAVFLRFPRPLFWAVFGREWFVEAGREGTRPVSRDIFEPAGRSVDRESAAHG